MPPTFAAVVGHAAVAAQLQSALAEARLSHATLLSGPEGVGKTTLAEALASAALDGEGWPGGVAAHPDHWLEDSDAERIGIDRLRAGGGTAETGPSLQEFFALRAYAGGLRVAVVARADRLTEQAANCMLKTLEEPPAGSHIVLCAANPERLPETILSRCQAFACAPVPAPTIVAWLTEQHAVDPRLAAMAAALAAGRPGRALRLATAPGALRTEVDSIDAFLAAAGGSRARALQVAGELAPTASAEGRERALAQVAAWTSFVRDVACLAGGAPELAVWSDFRPAAERWAEALPPDRVVEILERCVVAADQLSAYAVPRLLYEVLFLDVFAHQPAPPPVAPPQHDAALAGPVGEAATKPSRTRTPRRRG